MPTVEDGIKSQLRNIEKEYGRTIDELVHVVNESKLVKHGEIVAMLKQQLGMSHAAAHRVALTARNRADPPAATGIRIAPALEDVYALLLKAVDSLGEDIESVPKKGYVSLRRRKQFAMLQPGARWINVGLVLPNRQSAGRLETAAGWNALFTHRVRVSAKADVDEELKSWLRRAYDAAL